MSDNLYQLYTTQFSSNLELKLQQMGSKLRGKVAEGAHVGKMASPINQVAPIQAKAPAGKFAPKNRTDADFTRRWVFPVDREIDQLIDTFDELKTIVDPKSQYVTNASNAMGRALDDITIAAAFGTSYTGVDAGSLSAETWASFSGVFDVASTFGSSAASGLTVAKIIQAKKILQHYENDFDTDPLFMVIGSQQSADLLGQVEVVSTEYNDKPVLVDGKVTRFLGVEIVTSERLNSVSSNTIREVIFGVKSGLYMGLWKDVMNRVSIRNDLSSEPYDLYTQMSVGATRTQPGKLIKINCADTTGAPIDP